jgi:hypothetical protein
MGSVVPGSTYLIAPPPKSHSHGHLIASLLCHPITHPHLLLQLQRKDPDTRHALPQFDLVCRRSGRLSRKDINRKPDLTTAHNGRRPRVVAVQRSDTGERIATAKYARSMCAAQKRKHADDDSLIGVVQWNYAKSMVRNCTVHRFETSRKQGKTVGYEFRLETNLVREGYVSVRWTKKIMPPIQERPLSLSGRHRRSSSISSRDGPRRRHTYPATPTTPPAPPEPKWEFYSPKARRVMASMTPQKIHIHSISSSTLSESETTVSSPSSSDFDDEIHLDRELTVGRMLEFLIITGLLVGLEEDFASTLRDGFLTAGRRRIPSSEDIDRLSIVDLPVIQSPRRPGPKPMTIHPPIVETASVMSREIEDPAPPQEEIREPSIKTVPPSSGTADTSYATRGWGYLTNAASHMTRLLSF